MQKGIKVLVTGGAGFIGSHVVGKLIESGYSIVILDSLINSTERTVMRYSKGDSDGRISFYKVDINDKNQTSNVFSREGIDRCIHLAANISVADSILNPDKTMKVNFEGTRNILELCSEYNVSNFVFASSAAVYGDCKTLPIREDYQLKPLSPYGASKVEAERIVLSYDNSKIENAISLRFFNVYGKGQTPEYAGVITKFAERIKRNLPPIIYGDGAQSRDFVAVDDVVKAIILALTVPPQKMEQTISGRVYNVGTGVSCTIKDLALTMTRALKRDLQPIFLEQKEGDIKHSCAETTKSKEDLGFIAKVNLYSGLKQIMPDL